MPFLSVILNRQVVDSDGEPVGKVKDIAALMRPTMPHPELVALQVTTSRKTTLVSLSDILVLFAPVISLSKPFDQISPYQETGSLIYLGRDVLDKQIIDTDGMRVVRVNDLEVSRVGESVFVANVDVSSAGLLRRMGLPSLARRALRRNEEGLPKGIITWDAVELLPGDQPLRLKVPSQRLVEIHPADLAEIVSDLNRSESSRFLLDLDDKTLADTLEEVEPDFQAELVSSMPDDRVADILEEMSPDEAADLLAELPEERSDELLSLMEPSEADEIRQLLTYPEDSAGGIMTPDYVSVRAEMTAEQVIAYLREEANEAETIFYVYVVDEENRLSGVFSLRELIMARPESKVSDFMQDRVVTVDLLEPQEEVAKIVAKYNLLAIPVVDENLVIHGIVTADDALDKIIPTTWKKRLPRLYH